MNFFQDMFMSNGRLILLHWRNRGLEELCIWEGEKTSYSFLKSVISLLFLKHLLNLVACLAEKNIYIH